MLQKQRKLISSFPLLFMKPKHFQSFLLSTKRFCLNFIHVIRLMDFFQNCLATKENVLLTIIFVYGAEDAGKVHQKDDPFTEQKNRLNDLEAKYGGREPKSKIIPWMSIKTDIPSQVKSKFYHGIHPKHNFQLRIMDVIVRTKKFATDSLFFLTSAHANVSGDMLNRCRMNAITGKFLFHQMSNLYR